MTAIAELPLRSPDLQLAPSEDGAGVVKVRRTGRFFWLGGPEFFLLSQFDGTTTPEQLAGKFAERFGQPLEESYLGQYIEFARSQGWLADCRLAACSHVAAGCQPAEPTAAPVRTTRIKLLDPDRLLTRMEPWFRWAWTPGFALLSLAAMFGAGMILWSQRAAFTSDFTGALQWQTLVVVWLMLIGITVLHEFAHGLTCKHFGGEVHDMGFMVLVVIPCLYCDVSDAWLFPKKSHRLLVTLAGAWFDLCLWALAVLLWRVSVPDSLVNYLALVAASVLVFRCFINLTPLFKLDGYYLLCDGLGVRNLYQRGAASFRQAARSLLWGETPMTTKSENRWVTAYGGLTWVLSLVMVGLFGYGLYHLVGGKWTPVGIAGLAAVGMIFQKQIAGLGANGEAAPRFGWFGRWAATLLVIAAILCIPFPDWVHGSIELRPKQRVQVRAPIAGFIQAVPVREGDVVKTGARLLTLDVPDLTSRLAQKQAELQEARARLALLEAGPRREEVEWQQRRTATARSRVKTAEERLERVRREEAEEAQRLAQKVAEYEAERDAAAETLQRTQALRRNGVVSAEALNEAEKRDRAAAARVAQVQAEQRGRQIAAAKQAEDDLALRQEELHEAEAELKLAEAGSRPEEVDAEKARIARITEELQYLQYVQRKLVVPATADGVVTTQYLNERLGEYVREGDLLCELEDVASYEAEIQVLEDNLARIDEGQPVRIRVRAMPFEAFPARIDRISPRARFDEHRTHGTLTCIIQDASEKLRPGMTGSARIETGYRAIGALLLDRSTRFLKNEFWWW